MLGVEAERQLGNTKPFHDQTEQLKTLAYYCYKQISRHQLPNGLIPASVGRYDDESFGGPEGNNVWLRDAVYASQHAVNPHVKTYLPELFDAEFVREHNLLKTPTELYLSNIRGLFRVFSQKDQIRRLSSRPTRINGKAYGYIEYCNASAIKYSPTGHIIFEWGHNQPDSVAAYLQTAARGIRQNLPLLEPIPDLAYHPGYLLGLTTAYMVGINVGRLECLMAWEEGPACNSSYSTRRKSVTSLEDMYEVWDELITDSKRYDYKLPISKNQLKEDIDNQRALSGETFPADYTSREGHHSASDLATAFVLNDPNTPEEAKQIIRIKLQELENDEGFYRYFGDVWKRGCTEAKWILGKPLVALDYFIQALRQIQNGNNIDAYRLIDHGWYKITTLSRLLDRVGWIPELLEECYGYSKPNNNELAMVLGFAIEACATGIAGFNNYFEKFPPQ